MHVLIAVMCLVISAFSFISLLLYHSNAVLQITCEENDISTELIDKHWPVPFRIPATCDFEYLFYFPMLLDPRHSNHSCCGLNITLNRLTSSSPQFHMARIFIAVGALSFLFCVISLLCRLGQKKFELNFNKERIPYVEFSFAVAVAASWVIATMLYLPFIIQFDDWFTPGYLLSQLDSCANNSSLRCIFILLPQKGTLVVSVFFGVVSSLLFALESWFLYSNNILSRVQIGRV